MARLARDISGSTALEFALVMPVLLLLLIGGIEFGMLMYTKNSMQNAVRDAARQLAVNYIEDSGADPLIAGEVPDWVKGKYSVAIAHSAPGDPLQNLITVSTTLRASQASVVSFVIPMIGDFDVTTAATMKQEDVL